MSCLQAYHAVHAYPRHSHDYYVVAVVDSGVQSFTLEGRRYFTPVDGLILLNPGEMHTGEPVDEHGFVYRAFYPTIEHMQLVSAEIGGRGLQPPTFTVPRADDAQMSRWIRSLFAAFRGNLHPLEAESRFLLTLAELIKRFGGLKSTEHMPGSEPDAVQKVRDYIDENYAQPISLSQLADHVHFSRYYLLHIFREATGMPPHVYLESVRVRHAQRLLAEGQPLAQVAYDVGFGSQSHFTQRFKQIIGVTPGIYARQVAR
ncbi:MAG: AraC family transcriptional regulator [Anaerolineae bacterium]